jgi:two-component system, chemotaxis family, protein-glutamate methylesterase/glutaminase
MYGLNERAGYNNMKNQPQFVVGIGASAGGHHALQEFFEEIPAGLPAAFVIVMHLLRDHHSMLTEIMSKYVVMPVERIHGIVVPEAGRVYVMPENVLLEIRQGILYLTPRPDDYAWNQAINVFFTSLAHDQRDRAIGVILSGMGSDGAAGSLMLYRHGGEVLVQEPASAQYDSMPRATIQMDHPDFVLPPRELGQRLATMLLQVDQRASNNR